VQLDPACKSATTTQLNNLQLTKKHTFALAHVELWDFDKERSVQDVISAARKVQGVIGVWPDIYYSGHHILNCIAIANLSFRTHCGRQCFTFRVQAGGDQTWLCGNDQSPEWGGSISSPGRSLRSPGLRARHPSKALSRATLLRFGLEPPRWGLSMFLCPLTPRYAPVAGGGSFTRGYELSRPAGA